MAASTVALLTNAGGAHLDAYITGLAEVAEAESIVVADPSGACEANVRAKLGQKLKSFERDHARALADHQPSMALITLEGVQSPSAIQAALEANCHVLAEKPGCVRAEDFAPLVRLAEMKHRNLMLALGNRTRPTVREARKLIQAGDIGQIYGVELHIIADQTRLKSPAYHKSWFADRARAGGGHLIWLGIHWLDLVMYLTGLKIVETCGFTGIVGGQPLKIEDSAAMALRFDNGSFGTVTSGYYLDKGYHSHIKIWGSHGWLLLEPHGATQLQWYSTKVASPQVTKYAGPVDTANYTPLVREFVQSSLGQIAPPLTGADSLRVLQTVFACYRAAETGQTQKVG